MGFLDHSTNNIIVDAVLTERGRQLLAQNKLNIQGYSFGDDEVDYSLVVKYGETVGKEKIQKNTPIFEASTSSINPIQYFLYTDTNLSDGVELLSTSSPVVNNTGNWSFEVSYNRTNTNTGATETVALPDLNVYWNPNHLSLTDTSLSTQTLSSNEVMFDFNNSNNLTSKMLEFTIQTGVEWGSTVVRISDPITSQSAFVTITNS